MPPGKRIISQCVCVLTGRRHIASNLSRTEGVVKSVSKGGLSKGTPLLSTPFLAPLFAIPSIGDLIEGLGQTPVGGPPRTIGTPSFGFPTVELAQICSKFAPNLVEDTPTMIEQPFDLVVEPNASNSVESASTLVEAHPNSPGMPK